MTAMPHLAEINWDFKDQLQRVDLGGGGTAYYVYNTTGQRVRKVIERQNNTRQKERFYLGGFEIYREYNGSGKTISLERETLHITDNKETIVFVDTRTQGNDESSNQLLRFQFSNHLGSAALELDDQGAIISYEEYYSYGGTAYQAGHSITEVSLKRYRYTGKERDEETGLYYHGARYYSPWLGRWISCDPKGIKGGVNTYAYVRGNPINFNDPNGRDRRTWINRGIGVIQLVGGGLEIAVGAVGIAAPTGVTQVLGAVAVVHGVDTASTGLMTIWTGEVQQTLTQQAASGTARVLGASETTAERVGVGVDLAAGIIPSAGVGVARAVATRGAVEATTQVATHAAPEVAAQTATHAAPEVAAQTAAHAAPEAAAQTAAHAAPEVAAQTAAHAAPEAAAQTAAHAAPEVAAQTAAQTAAHTAPEVAAQTATHAAPQAATQAATHTAPQAAAPAAQAATRGPIFADTDLLIAASMGHRGALGTIRSGLTYITPNQYREFLNVLTSTQRRQLQAFLRAEAVQIYSGPRAAALAARPEFQATFRAVAPQMGRGDAALAAFARATGYEAVTMERRLFNFLTQTLRLPVPIRKLPR